ncbi:MAG: hypothetical protein H6Q68_204 [Firmicutes bacterium]|nr:hypothetical protein [Bacillota bacterium]
MALNRFLVLAFLIFSLGIVILYNGLNRVPLRQIDPNTPHKHGHSSLFLNDLDLIQKRS